MIENFTSVYISKRPETEKEAIPILFLILAFRALLRSGSREQDNTVYEISQVIHFQKAGKYVIMDGLQDVLFRIAENEEDGR